MNKPQNLKEAVQCQPKPANTKADKCANHPKKSADDTNVYRKIGRLAKQFLIDVDLALSCDDRCVRRGLSDRIPHRECECRTFAYMDIMCAMSMNYLDKCKEIEKSRLPADSPARFKPCDSMWNRYEGKEDIDDLGASQEKEPKRAAMISSKLIDFKTRCQQMDTVAEPPAVKIVDIGSDITVLRIG